MAKHIPDKVFTIRRDVKCKKCGNIGAAKFYGNYYSHGTGEKSDPPFDKYEHSPYMNHAIGFGGTIPYQCLNEECNNTGLIDCSGLEGYEEAFETIRK